MKGVLEFLLGGFDAQFFHRIFLSLLFFICLFSTTCFFFDIHVVHVFGSTIVLPIGLLFFPFTYVVSNIIQDRFGLRVANAVVVCSFIVDVVLVLMACFMAFLGDRRDYMSVFFDLPFIMMASLLFVFVSALFNSFLFGLMQNRLDSGRCSLFLSFLGSNFVAELLVTSMSMPILFIRRDLSNNLLLTVFIAVLYKIFVTFVASSCYVYLSNRRGMA